LTDTAASPGRRARIVTGVGIIAASLLAAAAVAGVGFASGSVSAAQYQYGKVTICHHTGHSKKHPGGVTITVSKHAWDAHFSKTGVDTLGPCSSSTTGKNHTKGHGKGNGKGKGHNSTPPTTTTTTTTSTPPSHGKGGGNGQGQGHKK
jgi:hypothetical protein